MDEDLDDILKVLQQDEQSLLGKIVAWTGPIVAVVVLSFVAVLVTYQMGRQQLALVDQEYQSFRQVDEARRATDGLTLFQAMFAETRVNQGRNKPFEEMIGPVLDGIDAPTLDEMRQIRANPASGPMLELVYLERTLAPLAKSGREILNHPRYIGLQALEPDAAAYKARAAGVALSIQGVSRDLEPACQVIWALPRDQSGVDTLVWKAECDRKLRDAAHAIPTFQEAVSALEALPQWKAPGTMTEADRTLAVLAARAYNGLAMSLVAAGGGRDSLDRAHGLIETAIDLRQRGLMTRAQIAGYVENRAIIEYRLGREGDDGRYGAAFCTASTAIDGRRTLAWSWTLLHLLDQQGLRPDPRTCEREGGGRVRFPSSGEINRTLTFFERGSFGESELNKLLDGQLPDDFFERVTDAHERLESPPSAWSLDVVGETLRSAFGRAAF